MANTSTGTIGSPRVSFNELLRLLRRFRFLAISVALLVVAGGSAVALRSPDRFSSTATVVADPPIVANGSAPDVNQIDFLIPQYLARLGSNTFISSAADRLPAAVETHRSRCRAPRSPAPESSTSR